jgi:DNA-binding MarR family transcriptional regulator
MPAPPSSTAPPHRPGTLGSKDFSFYIGRFYSHYCLALDDSLLQYDLAAYIRPGVGPLVLALFEQDGRTLRELGEIADLSPSTITALAQKLERTGALCRERCEQDGRAIRVTLKKLGRSLRQPLEAVSREVNGILHGDLSAVEVNRLNRILAGMIAARRGVRIQARKSARATPAKRIPRNAAKSRRQ